MKKTIIALAIALAWAATAAADPPVPPKTHPDTTGWTDLFAPDLANAVYPKGIWSFQNGVLTATKDDSVWTKKEYQDFILDLEFKNSPGTNSGVLLYATDINGSRWIPNSVEVQLLDDYFPQNVKIPNYCKCAAIYGHLAPAKQTVKKAGQWNHMTVTCLGPKVSVILNGELVTELDMTKFTSAKKNPDGSDIPRWLSNPLAKLATKGHIGLQGRHGDAPPYFRNVKIKELN